MYIISTLINRQDCDLLHDLCMAARAYFGKLGIVTIISVVLFRVVLYFCDVYLCILACIFIHKLLHSYTYSVDKFFYNDAILYVVLKTMCECMRYCVT